MESSQSLAPLLEQLEAAKRQFGPNAAELSTRLLNTLGRRRFLDAQELIRFHEALLFVCAYPANPRILRIAGDLLQAFPKRIERLRRAGVDMEPFAEPDVSGIAGTAFSAIFSYDIARWLVCELPSAVDIDWDSSDAELLGPLLRRLHALSGEDLMVEANIPFLDWFRAAKGKHRGTDLSWLIWRIEALPLEPLERSELYAGARLAVRWSVRQMRDSRTGMRLSEKKGKVFYQHAPLLRRSDVSLAAELNSPKIVTQRLSSGDGQRILDTMRETSALRYRELHGFTYGDPAHMDRAELGRGVEFFVCGVPPAHRLPLRAYHAGMFFKNSVPMGYIECLTLFERMEVGFNLYYTFRDGETAWLYGRLLRLFRQMLGVTCFSVDPYQIGLHNEEAIESGAFWFYRKLGFRPTNPGVAVLLAKEERQLQNNPAYRTSSKTLRRMAETEMIYELPDAPKGDWDRFELRRAAMALSALPFSAKIRQAKKSPMESRYVRVLQEDVHLRRKILNLGSRSPSKS